MTAVDSRVLEILGENSAQVCGLPVHESAGQFVETVADLYLDDREQFSSTVRPSDLNPQKTTQSQTRKRRIADFLQDESVEELRRKRWEQDVEIQQLKKKKLCLEIQFLERELSKL